MFNKIENKAMELKIKGEIIVEDSVVILKNKDGAAGGFESAGQVLLGIVIIAIVGYGMINILEATVMPGVTEKITEILNLGN